MRFLLLLTIAFSIGVSFVVYKTDASGQNQFINSDSYITNVNILKVKRQIGWYPPRIQQMCYDNFIGVEYNPRLEKRCRVLWNIWTKEIVDNWEPHL